MPELPLSRGASNEVAHFRVRRECFLDADGSVHGDLPGFARDRSDVVGLYEAMFQRFQIKAQTMRIPRWPTGRRIRSVEFQTPHRC